MSIKYILILTLFISCGTAFKINPKGCISGAIWEHHPKELLDYESQYQPFKPLELYEEYDFVLKKRINSPFGLFHSSELYLKTLFEREHFQCEDVKSLNITTTSEWFDILSSFIPFLATKTVYVYGRLWSKELKIQTGREDLEEKDLEELEIIDEKSIFD